MGSNVNEIRSEVSEIGSNVNAMVDVLNRLGSQVADMKRCMSTILKDDRSRTAQPQLFQVSVPIDPFITDTECYS